MVGMITSTNTGIPTSQTYTLQLHKDIVMCEMCTVASLTQVLTFAYFTVICLLFIDTTLVKLCPCHPLFLTNTVSRVPTVDNHETKGRVRFKGGYRV